MTMPTLILPPRYSSDSVTLWRTALSAGWNVERLHQWQPPAWLRERQPVIYGEPLFAATVAEALNLSLFEPTLDWLTRVPQGYLNRDVHFMALNEVEHITQPAFIKPADDKCFPAGIYESGAELLRTVDLPKGLPVLVSEPVRWEVEYRCFVCEGQVAAISPYLRDGHLVETASGDWLSPSSEVEEAQEFASNVLEDQATPFPPAAVLDVGKIAGCGWSVVEANPAWSSGIYGCDPSQVLSVLARACVEQSQVTAQDRLWMIDRTGLA